MYKFTNGFIVYTIEDRDNLLKSGYKLVEVKTNENNNNSRTITGESEKGSKTNKRIQRKLQEGNK